MLGKEHPSTLDSMSRLAVVYRDQGRYDEAEPLYTKTLEIRRRVLGEGHPDTLESVNNLVELYEAWGKQEKAEEWRARLPRKKDTEEK